MVKYDDTRIVGAHCTKQSVGIIVGGVCPQHHQNIGSRKSEYRAGKQKGMNQDTIAAISTGLTNSGIGIVRISGSEALEIADRVYKGKETITEVPTHTIHYGHVMDGDETVDEVLVMVMRGPRTFTGEDTVEINCHGGTYVVSRVLETVLKAGARPAEPGEFTKRAFLNGKMDLSQRSSM